MSEAISFEDAWARIDKFAPPRSFDALRKERPLARMVYPDGHVGWIVTSHELARQVLGGPKFSHDLQIAHFPVTKAGSPIPPLSAMPGMFIHMDPPEQTRYRRLLTKEFTMRGVSRLAPAVEAVAAEQLAEMRAQGGTADFLKTFARPLVLKVLAPLIGLDYSQRGRFADAPAVVHDASSDMQIVMDAMQPAVEFIHETRASKKAMPGDDIISRLIATGELSDEELANIALLLLFAGYETTEGALTMGTFALLHHTEQLAALRSDLSKIDDAVEEILRYVTVNQYEIFRTALEDAELGGGSVRKGETVTVSLPAANRDPAKFGCPARLDLDRDASGHVAFGYGVHQCVGQNLARLVLKIGLRSLLEALPRPPAGRAGRRGSAADQAIRVLREEPARLLVTVPTARRRAPIAPPRLIHAAQHSAGPEADLHTVELTQLTPSHLDTLPDQQLPIPIAGRSSSQGASQPDYPTTGHPEGERGPVPGQDRFRGRPVRGHLPRTRRTDAEAGRSPGRPRCPARRPGGSVPRQLSCDGGELPRRGTGWRHRGTDQPTGRPCGNKIFPGRQCSGVRRHWHRTC